MHCIKVGAASLNQTPLDWEGNYQNILDAIDSAFNEGVALLCLPELCITGYGCEDRFHSPDVLARAADTLVKITKEVLKLEGPHFVVCVGLPVTTHNAVYNAVAVISSADGLLGLVVKQHLAGDGLHYEPRWFKPWPAGFVVELEEDDSQKPIIPIGDIQFQFGDIRVGFEICEDAWVAERPGGALARKGVDIILNPSASHFAFGKRQVRERFVTEGSRAFSVTYVYANLLGNEAGRAIYDGQCFIATGGSLIAESRQFSMKPYTLLTAVVDVDTTKTTQRSSASFQPQTPGAESYFVQSKEFKPSLDIPKNLAYTIPAASEPYEDFSNAIALALFDYMRKSRSKGFVISLSGGADSAACAVLVYAMVSKGFLELGPLFNKILGIDSELVTVQDVMRQILTCAYQGTKNSSTVTLDAAQAVAEDVGAKFVNIDVDGIVEAYKAQVSKAMGWDLSWEKDDVTLQNIQARVRAPSIWMIANKEGKLLITTSNRSEAAVGYCTMDGDTAGSIAPIGAIDKAFLLDWLLHVTDTMKLQSLEEITCQQPTAELRPQTEDYHQTDEKDLMPYPILEFIEDLAILEKRGPDDVHTYLMGYFNRGNRTLSKELAYTYVEKFFTLWCRNQWKRERYALSFHVDDKNLDPRSWCRFPVLSGGFVQELKELRERLGL